MRRLIVEEYEYLVEVGMVDGLVLSEGQENYIRSHTTTWYDQVNGAYWVSFDVLKECAFMLPNSETYPHRYNLQQAIERIQKDTA